MGETHVNPPNGFLDPHFFEKYEYMGFCLKCVVDVGLFICLQDSLSRMYAHTHLPQRITILSARVAFTTSIALIEPLHKKNFEAVVLWNCCAKMAMLCIILSTCTWCCYIVLSTIEVLLVHSYVDRGGIAA